MSKAQKKRKRTQTSYRQPGQSVQPGQLAQSHAVARAEQKRRQQHPSRNKVPWIWGGGFALAVVIIVGIFLFVQNQNQSSNNSSSSIKGVVTYSNLSRDHVTGKVNYPQVPPVGGPHNPVWLNCGIYDTPVANENAVHSMEHGAVWMTYQPTLSSADVRKLQNLVRGHSYVILSPYPGLPTPVVISAWGVQLKVSSPNDPRLAQFIAKYEQGPQTPEQGSPCTGGTGTPLP